MNFIKKHIFNFNSQQDKEDNDCNHPLKASVILADKERVQHNDLKIIQTRIHAENLERNKSSNSKSIIHSQSKDKLQSIYSTAHLKEKSKILKLTDHDPNENSLKSPITNHTANKTKDPILDHKLSIKRRNELNLLYNSVDIKEDKMKKYWSHQNKISISMNFLSSFKKKKKKEETKKDIPVSQTGKKILNSSSLSTQSEALNNLKFNSNELKEEKRLEDSESKSQLLITVKSISNIVMKKNRPSSCFNNLNQVETTKRNPTPICSTIKEKGIKKKVAFDKTKKKARSQRLSMTPNNININYSNINKPPVITAGPYVPCSNLKYHQVNIFKKREKISPIQERKLSNDEKKESNQVICFEISPGDNDNHNDEDDTTEFLSIQDEDKLSFFNDQILFKRVSSLQEDQSKPNNMAGHQKELKSQSFTFPQSQISNQIHPLPIPLPLAMPVHHQHLNHHKSQSHSQVYQNLPIKLQSIPKLTLDIHEKDLYIVINYLHTKELLSLSLVNHKLEKLTRKTRYNIIRSKFPYDNPRMILNQRNIIWNRLRNYSKLSQEKYFKKTYFDNAFKHSLYLIDIKKDIIRTYPNNPTFNESDPIYIKLQSILNAFANYNKTIGYAQGMNFILSKIIQRGYNEEESFIYLDAIISKLQMDHIYGFGQTNKLPQIMNRLSKLLSTHLPEFDTFLDNYSLTHEFCTANWVITLFSSSTLDEDLYMIWDYIFIFGWKFIHYFIVSIIKTLYKTIIIFPFEEFSQLMKSLLFNSFKENSQQIINLAMKLMEEDDNENNKKNDTFGISMKRQIESNKKEIIKPKETKKQSVDNKVSKANNVQSKEKKGIESNQEKNNKSIKKEVIESIQKEAIEPINQKESNLIQQEVIKESSIKLIEPIIPFDNNFSTDPLMILQITLLNQEIKSLKDCILTEEYDKEKMKESYDIIIKQLKDCNSQYKSQITIINAKVDSLLDENNKLKDKMSILKQNVMKVKEHLDGEVYPKLDLKTKLLKETIEINDRLVKKITVFTSEEINIKALEEQMRLYRDKFNEGLKERIEVQHLANKQEGIIKNYEHEIKALRETIHTKENKYKELDKAYISILRVIDEHKKTIRNLNNSRNYKQNEMQRSKLLLSQKEQEINLLRSYISTIKKDNTLLNPGRYNRNESIHSHKNLKPIKTYTSTMIGVEDIIQGNNNHDIVNNDTDEDDLKIKEITVMMNKLVYD